MPQIKKTYVAGSHGFVKRRDQHTGGWTNITPNVDAGTIWQDVMAHSLNPDHVVVVGNLGGTPQGGLQNGILVSFDAGVTWQEPGGDWNTAQSKNFYDVWICNDDLTQPTIWVAGSYGGVFKSTDGGLTFYEQTKFGINSPGDARYTTSLHGINELVCVVTGYQNNIPDNYPLDFELTGADRVYVWKTIDGGLTWDKLNSGSSYSDRRFVNTLTGSQEGYSHGIWIAPDQSKIIVSTNYVQFVSTDFGANFIPIPPASLRSNHHMTWYPDHDPAPSRFRRTGGFPGQAVVTESIDVGATWSLERSGDPDTLYGAHFYSPQNGYYVQRTPDIYDTSNGGVTGNLIFTETAPGVVWYAIHTSQQDNTIYRLENCEGVANDQFVTDPNMAQYVGQVINIDPSNIDQDLPATLCWEVFIHDQSVGTYDQPVPVLGSFADCNECNPKYYQLTDCQGNEAPIYTTSDLSQYVAPLPTAKISLRTLELTPCCGGPILRTALIGIGVPLPVWTDTGTLANMIKFDNNDGEGQKCYLVADGPPLGFVQQQPPGWIDTPLDNQVIVLNSTTCSDAVTEDPDCDCDNNGQGNNPVISLGIVVQIDGCYETCWEVSEIQPDTSLELTEVSVTESYTDCEECLAEPEPEEEVREIRPRTVDPGYSTGQCDPEIVEKAKCDYSNLMYDKMMSNRFKIEICCKQDEEKVFMQYEKIRLKLLEGINPTPDPCDPKCSKYEFTVNPTDSAVITYIDCYENAQTINVDSQDIPNLVYFCGLDTNPPIAVVTHADNSTDTYILEPLSKDCVPPAQDIRGCSSYEVRMSNFSPEEAYFEYEDCNGEIQRITKDGGQKNIALYSFCALEGQVFEPVGLTTDDTFTQEELGPCSTEVDCCITVRIVSGTGTDSDPYIIYNSNGEQYAYGALNGTYYWQFELYNQAPPAGDGLPTGIFIQISRGTDGGGLWSIYSIASIGQDPTTANTLLFTRSFGEGENVDTICPPYLGFNGWRGQSKEDQLTGLRWRGASIGSCEIGSEEAEEEESEDDGISTGSGLVGGGLYVFQRIHQYRIEVEGGYNFADQIITYRDANSNIQQIDLLFSKDGYQFQICAQHASVTFNGSTQLFIVNDVPECNICAVIPGITVTYEGEC
jgi:hypothetical protein